VTELRTPTPEQAAAIGVDGPAAIRAGAGCGKTAVLAERFVHLLGAGAEVSDVLAITFTEKAAAEMKERIREVVANELAHAPEADGARWQRIRRELLGAQISTIHAFCARVLRENPLEADVDPRAAVLDEHESRAYIEAAVETALLARLRAGDPAAREVVLRWGLAGGRTGGAVGRLADFLAWLARAGLDGRWLVDATAAQAARAPQVATGLAHAAGRIVAAVDARVARAGRGAGIRALAAEWPVWRGRLCRIDAETPLEDFVALVELRDLLADARLAKDLAKDLAVQDGRLRGAFPDAYGFLRALPENVRLAQLIADLRETVRARKRDDSVLTFDDLIAETRAVLAGHPAVRARYARRFRAVLVDEFQDTDRVQADVIRLLVEGTPAPELFVVGDEKQSIYRFRGADVSVFQAACREAGRELTLGTNFRSLPPLLDFVNALAARLFDPPAGGDAAHWTRFDARHRLVPHRAPVAGPPAVRLVSFVEEHRVRTLDVAQARELEARVLAGVVARLHEQEGIAYQDVAVLFRAFTEVKTYENALRRREIPYYVVKGRGFFQCQEVTDVVSLLATVLDPDDEIALAAALRSPLFAVDDDLLWRLASPPDAARPALARRFRARETFADLDAEAAARMSTVRDLLIRLRAAARRGTIAEIIELAATATDFEAVCLTQFQGAQKVANVRKLIELARAWERKRLFSLRDFVRAVRRLAETEPREPEAPLVSERDDVVRLMTIHQAKGLEFPVVLVPDLGRALKPDYTIPALDEQLGVVGGPLDATGWVAVGHAGLEEHRARERDRERAEQARLLYVACTRARDVLVLLEGKGDARWLRDAGGDAFVWCHQVWDVVGHENVATFAGAAEPERTATLASGAIVRLERASRYAGAGVEPSMPAARVAPAGDAERAHVRRVLGFAPPRPAEMTTSPTALADFRRCPRQYWYRQVARVPERGTGGVRAAWLGTAAHAVLESQAAEADVETVLAQRPEAIFLRPRELRALAEDLRVATRTLAGEHGFEVIGREVPFVLGLPRAAPRVFLHGRMDVIGRRGAVPVVRDFKYAAASAAEVASYVSQLAAYRLAAAPAPGTPADAELVFLRGGTTIRALPPIDAAAEEAAFVAAADGLAAALADGTMAAFARTPPDPSACEALGCGYVRRCWAPTLTGTAARRPAGSAAS